MAGGILQLVASTGKEDEIISINPHITMFKTVYRRHVNFDKAEQMLNFDGNLNFGIESTCKLKKLADLVSALTLVIDLPKIDISYIPLTNVQLALMLKQYGIIWQYDPNDAQKLVTQSEIEEVVGIIEYDAGKMVRITNGMINDHISNLSQTIEKDNKFMEVIQTITDEYISTNNTNLSNYLDDLMLELLLSNRELFIDDTEYIDNYDYYNQYLYLHSYKSDLTSLIPQAISWQSWVDPVQITHTVTSFYDPSIGLPISPSVGDMYICSNSDRGWNVNSIYRWFISDNPIAANWIETSANLGFGSEIAIGYDNMPSTLLYECVGFKKLVNGLYDPTSGGFPENPLIGDSYISTSNHSAIVGGENFVWIENNIYTWSGTTWTELIPTNGNSIYVTGSGNNYGTYKQRLVYYNGVTWEILQTPMSVLYDGTFWRKNVISFHDPTGGLPAITIPTSIGNTYISSATGNGWTKNNIYVWDGWEWVEKVPTDNYGLYIMGGQQNANCIVVYNGLTWNVRTLNLPLYNYDAFRKLVSSALQNIIFTDTNIELLYGVENCNTTIIPQTSILPIRTFFDNIVQNEIGIIDVNSAVYKSVYNVYSGFDGSFAGNLAHVSDVQSGLSAAIRNEISNVINPNIQMMTTLYGRLQFVDALTPDYYRFNYYKYFQYDTGTSTYDTTAMIVNCPRDYYTYSSSETTLLDYFSSYIMKLPTNTDYVTLIKSNTTLLVGNQTGSTNGTLYETFADTRVQSLFNNLFVNLNTPYTTVLETIKMGTVGSDTRRIYNLPSCINNLSTVIQTNIVADYTHFINVLPTTLGTKGTFWGNSLGNIVNFINTNIPIIEQIAFPISLWNTTFGFLSKMTQSTSSLDKMATFIFRYYLPYDVGKLLPVDYSFVPSFVIQNKNPIEYLVLTFTENLTRYIISQNGIIGDEYKLTSTELSELNNKINYIGAAYLDTGLQNYTNFVLHQTNILEENVPELFAPINPIAIETYHLPYDGITSITCYLLNQMKNKFNTYYQAVTTQSIYDNLGNPFMDVNERFVTDSNFYLYGNQMYNNGYSLIQSMIDVYLNDMTRYDTYGSVLKIKNLFSEQLTFMFNYPLEMYIEFHKAIYNNQNFYVTSTTYDDMYTNILSQLNDKMLPLLQYLNATNNIYMGTMDVLMISPENRLTRSLINPYDSTNDAVRYQWYNEKIINDVINVETDFEPNSVGIIEYFLSSINSPTNPFAQTLNLYNWYNELDRTKVSNEIVKMYKLFGLPYYSTNEYNAEAITPESLYNDLGNINYKYNGFADITDFIKYLMDHIVNWSQLGFITSLFKATIPATRDSLVKYYTVEKNNAIDMIDKIHPYTLTKVNGSVTYSTLENIVRNIYNKDAVNFAWIHEIGHYIVDRAQLLIGDAVIDQYTGEYAHLLCYTEGSKEHEYGYYHAIGNIPELYTYNNLPKRKYRLYIPLFFTFSKFYEAGLPLISMQHTDVSVRIKLKKLNEVAYWAPMTIFNKTPKLKCSIIADYIYLDHEERFRVAPLRHETITETIQYNGAVTVDMSKLDANNSTTVRLNFTGMSKEIYIVCQMEDYVNGTLPNGELKWNYYMVQVPKNETIVNGETVVEYLEVNPIDKMQINFNGRERETPKDAVYYNCIQRMKHHSVSIYDGINIYSFSISPQLLQPSGAANLGKISYVDLVITFRKDVIALVGKNQKTMRIGVYNKGSNILRTMSGLSGLAFYN